MVPTERIAGLNGSLSLIRKPVQRSSTDGHQAHYRGEYAIAYIFREYLRLFPICAVTNGRAFHQFVFGISNHHEKLRASLPLLNPPTGPWFGYGLGRSSLRRGVAAQTYINATVGGQIAPGVYGRVDIGNSAPALLYPQPVVIAPPAVYVPRSPIYMYVPPGHAKKGRC